MSTNDRKISHSILKVTRTLKWNDLTDEKKIYQLQINRKILLRHCFSMVIYIRNLKFCQHFKSYFNIIKTKDHHIITKDHHIITKDHHIKTKDHHIITKDHHIITKDHHIITKDHHIITKDHHIITKDHHIITKDHHIITKDHHKITKDHHIIMKDHHTITKDHHIIMKKTIRQSRRAIWINDGRRVFIKADMRSYILLQTTAIFLYQTYI